MNNEPISRKWAIIITVFIIAFTGILAWWFIYRDRPISEPMPVITPTEILQLPSTPSSTPLPTNTPQPTETPLLPTQPSVPSATPQPVVTVSPTLAATTIPIPTIDLCPRIRGGDFYQIKRGDTLWAISQEVYCSASFWPLIYEANPWLTNPDLIHADDNRLLWLPMLDYGK